MNPMYADVLTEIRAFFEDRFLRPAARVGPAIGLVLDPTGSANHRTSRLVICKGLDTFKTLSSASWARRGNLFIGRCWAAKTALAAVAGTLGRHLASTLGGARGARFCAFTMGVHRLRR